MFRIRLACIAMATALVTLAAIDRAGAAEARPHRDVTFGIFTPISNTTWNSLVGTWRLVEDLGFDSIWVNDHLIGTRPGDESDPQLEGWTTLAALATQTERIRIGVLVTGNTYRQPALLAKMAATVDEISGGRLTLGIGAGWFKREHEAFGIHFGTARERAERLEEALQLMTSLWSKRRSSFEGRYYCLSNAPFSRPNGYNPRSSISRMRR